MPYIDRKMIQLIAEDPVSVAVMMDDHELENVIAEFVSVLNQRIKDRGG